jgi:PAS domain-containing protein
MTSNVYKDVVADSPIPVVLLRLDGAIRFANAAFAQLMGFRNPSDLSHRQLTHLLEHPLEIQYINGLIKRFAGFEVNQFSMDLMYRGQMLAAVSCSSKFKLLCREADPTIALFVQRCE